MSRGSGLALHFLSIRPPDFLQLGLCGSVCIVQLSSCVGLSHFLHMGPLKRLSKLAKGRGHREGGWQSERGDWELGGNQEH